MITKYGFFRYCFKDENNKFYSFDTLTQAIQQAKKKSKEQPSHEFQIFGVSEIFIRNNKISKL